MWYGCYLEYEGKEKEASQSYNFVDENNENLNLESVLCYFDFITVNSLGDIYSKWLYYIPGSWYKEYREDKGFNISNIELVTINIHLWIFLLR